MEKLSGKEVNTAVFISGRGSNLKHLIKYSKKKFNPYVIGKISKNSKKVKINGKIKW